MGVDRPVVEVEFESAGERSATPTQKLRKLSSSLLNLIVSPPKLYIFRLISRTEISNQVVILCIGTNSEWESESYDREDMKLPPGTDELVRAVLSSKPETIIVNQSGMPVEFPWLDDASAIVQAFFGGNECGTAVADAVFGIVNPSGKLPITWPRVLEDYSSHEGFGHPINTVYSEGLGVGYRYFDRGNHPKSAFPFGHGLSYTSFTLRLVDYFTASYYCTLSLALIMTMTGLEKLTK